MAVKYFCHHSSKEWYVKSCFHTRLELVETSDWFVTPTEPCRWHQVTPGLGNWITSRRNSTALCQGREENQHTLHSFQITLHGPKLLFKKVYTKASVNKLCVLRNTFSSSSIYWLQSLFSMFCHYHVGPQKEWTEWKVWYKCIKSPSSHSICWHLGWCSTARCSVRAGLAESPRKLQTNALIWSLATPNFIKETPCSNQI